MLSFIVEKYFTVVLSIFNFTQFAILGNVSLLDLTLAGMKWLIDSYIYP